MHATAHGGCTDIVLESALEVDSGRKIPFRSGYLNPRQDCICFVFSQSDALPTEIFEIHVRLMELKPDRCLHAAPTCQLMSFIEYSNYIYIPDN